MSGLIHKVKDAISGEKHTPEAQAANQGTNGNQVTITCPFVVDRRTWADIILADFGNESVAHGGHTSGTNPGVLHSTQPGIHGERDSGTRTGLSSTGDDSRLTGTS